VFSMRFELRYRWHWYDL